MLQAACRQPETQCGFVAHAFEQAVQYAGCEGVSGANAVDDASHWHRFGAMQPAVAGGHHRAERVAVDRVLYAHRGRDPLQFGMVLAGCRNTRDSRFSAA